MKTFTATLIALFVSLAAAPLAHAHPGHAHDGTFAMYVSHAAQWLDDGMAIGALVGAGDRGVLCDQKEAPPSPKLTEGHIARGLACCRFN